MFSRSILNILKTTTTTTSKRLTLSTRFASSNLPKMSSTAFLDAVRNRRTIYGLEAKSPIPDSKIIDIVNETIKHVPSSYNSQSARAIVLLKAEHEKLWDIAIEVLKAIVPAEAFPPTLEKLNAFKAAYGTVLWFEGEFYLLGEGM